ncbi:universal stress protein [Marinobacter zhejiangensis]|uniref:Nucleotide-binding universal stress protein, UspA family n=1 Tax=Marinobacter zhejiangensis TaxID=488535 RepID=A0A1I4LP29_9GAMM|nr:universal stress protein [Marinobacter zhejiangensis]SFL92661.1 Nucleotide-binding universal stress protein, UspA family [Marinobacter zhejiangensis]
MKQVVGCIDGSRAATAVCDYGAWASQRLEAPLTLFHVLDQERYPAETDLAGSIGLGSREHLLQELAELDQRRSRVAMEQGRHMLEAAEVRVREQGVEDVHLRQRHGDLADSLLAIEETTRLLVMGLHGESSSDRDIHVGSQLETVIRSVHRPIMLVPDAFAPPRSALFAFDGSPTTLKALEMLAQSPILRGLPVHVVMVGADTADRWEQLRQAEQALSALGSDIHLAIRAGDVEKELHRYQREQDIDLLIMGAYGHSRIRQFLVGSTTTHMLKTSTTPLIILR